MTEDIKIINKRLEEYYGKDISSGQVIWRIVFSDDETEYRHGEFEDYSAGGIYLRTVTETRLCKKYEYIQGKYVLERLVGIPEQNRDDLPTQRMSYEPIHTFEDKNYNPLPVVWDAVQFLCELVHAAMGSNRGLKRYIDPEGTNEGHAAAKRKRVDAIQEALFGEQSSLAGATKTGEAVGYTKPPMIITEGIN